MVVLEKNSTANWGTPSEPSTSVNYTTITTQRALQVEKHFTGIFCSRLDTTALQRNFCNRLDTTAKQHIFCNTLDTAHQQYNAQRQQKYTTTTTTTRTIIKMLPGGQGNKEYSHRDHSHFQGIFCNRLYKIKNDSQYNAQRRKNIQQHEPSSTWRAGDMNKSFARRLRVGKAKIICTEIIRSLKSS